ncbi:HAD family hydrolase [Actinopolymorpha singaporensis]|uniref:Beta-phosphoglucomutase, HAD superfamily n=1 Tax=Actinopolymorpha singaporensis TaxID=117157 RepID=A0A1H1VSQ3_9ACTN|nr:HAD family hydrolase [Actinopolymorpha singaporensis]SDS87988.1 Beta-phosphoglucomutase, HAD superfamily [Actinopolymorpha singaporensis]
MNSPTLHLDRLDAALFGLDDVVVDTALLHATAWQRTFDWFLRRRGRRAGLSSTDRADSAGRAADDAEAGGETRIPPFELPGDYLRYAAGRTTAEGVRGFLTARGITLADHSAEPGEETVPTLADHKDACFAEEVRRIGVSAYPSSVDLLRDLAARGVRLAAVEGDRGCEQLLAAAGIADLFDVCVDGGDAALLGVPPQPDPGLLLEATHRLGVSPRRTAVVSGSLVGVEAGWHGCFEPIVAVDRYARAEDFYRRGAHVVVRDLTELVLSGRSRQELLAHR